MLNLLLTLGDILNPGQVAKYLSESFGYATSPSVIKKYDNMILQKHHPAKKGTGRPRRKYSESDVIKFNAILVMRSLGCSIEEIKRTFNADFSNPAAEKECVDFIDSVKERIAKQKKSLELFNDFFNELKKRQGVPGVQEEPVFKPATPEEIAKRKMEQS